MTSQVTAAELGRLQTDAAHWFMETVQVQRPIQVSNGKGGYHNDWTIVWTGKVQRRPMSESARGETADAPIGDRMTALSSWLFSFPAGTDVRAEDRIESGDRIYEVAGPALDKAVEIARYVVATERL